MSVARVPGQRFPDPKMSVPPFYLGAVSLSRNEKQVFVWSLARKRRHGTWFQWGGNNEPSPIVLYRGCHICSEANETQKTKAIVSPVT